MARTPATSLITAISVAILLNAASLSAQTGCGANSGPDVIAADLSADGGGNYSASGDLDAFAWGSSECNIGTQNLLYSGSTPNHPVVIQNMYRLSTVAGSARFEQVGMSWARHFNTAVALNLCACGCNGQGGSVLGIGCASVTTSGNNGAQCTTTGGLGPRFEINAHTGQFPYPYMFRNNCTYIPHTSVTRRCQVPIADLDPALNPGATYFAEVQYVAADDATAINQNSNCAHRQINISFSAGNATANSTHPTEREQPAIHAWSARDSMVSETIIDTPENAAPNPTGRCIFSAKATLISKDIYHYEFALFNFNSDRGISSFSIPVSDGLNVTNIGFHDVPYHDGDGYNSSTTNVVNFDGTDWLPVYASGAVTWSIVPANPVENSNALRWGTLYNFRFDCNAPPTGGNSILGLFKPVAGQPDFVSAVSIVPSSLVPCPCPGDFNDSNTVDGEDIDAFVKMYINAMPTSMCADIARPHGLGLDEDDVLEFANLLLADTVCP